MGKRESTGDQKADRVERTSQRTVFDEEDVILLSSEWNALSDLAMSLHGIIRLIDGHGFDESTGAEQLLRLAYRQYERTLCQIRLRVEEPKSCRETGRTEPWNSVPES